MLHFGNKRAQFIAKTWRIVESNIITRNYLLKIEDMEDFLRNLYNNWRECVFLCYKYKAILL